MSSAGDLSHAPDPVPESQVTTCERNCELLAGMHSQIVQGRYPRIQLRRGTDAHLRRLGTKGRSERASGPNTEAEMLISKLPAAMQTATKYLYDLIKTETAREFRAAVGQLQPSRRWLSSPAVSFSCHGRVQKFAIARHDDAIEIHDDRGGYDVLAHEHQKNVTCTQWSPLAPDVLAVGCRNGVFMWHTDKSGPPTSRLLPTPSVLTIEWSPAGDLIAVASLGSNAVVIWDVGRGVYSELRRGSKCCTLLKWSPCGRRLLAASQDTLRIWSTKTWSCTKWNACVQSACWSADGNSVLFSNKGESAVHNLSFISDTEQICAAVFHTSSVPLASGEQVGGSIQSLAWDQSGDRLVIVFEEESGCSLIAVLRAGHRRGLHPTFVAGGFIRGPSNTHCQFASFQENVPSRRLGQDVGAVLAVCWIDGKSGCEFAFIPFHFIPTALIRGINS